MDSNTQLLEYMGRLSGKDMKGDAKAEVIYQLFALEDEDDNPRKTTVYNFSTKVDVSVSYSKLTPQFIKLDLVFNAYDNTELKLFWGRLNQLDKLAIKEPNKTWVFHVNLTEVASVLGSNFDGILIGHFCNPVMSYLTRQTPMTLSEDRSVGGELLGGNVVRMLFAIETTSFEKLEGVDIESLRADAQVQAIGEEYIDNRNDETGFEDF